VHFYAYSFSPSVKCYGLILRASVLPIHLSSSSFYSVLFFALHHLYLCAYSGAALAEFFVFVGLQPTFLMLRLILQDLLLILLSAHSEYL
jgi:hypothetical protein